MGKVKRGRTKFHSAAAKASDINEGMETSTNTKPTLSDLQGRVPSLPGVGIFDGVAINPYSLNTKLRPDDDDFDTKSTITSKSFKGMNVKKKDKAKLRREFWTKKIDVIQTTRKEEKDRKRRKKTAIVGDMQPLEETLPTLDLLLRDSFKGDAAHRKHAEKPRGIKKMKRKQKEMMEDISVFQQVLKHPAYQNDPLATISEHLHNKAKQEDSMDV